MRKALYKTKRVYFVAAMALGTKTYLLLGGGKPFASLTEAQALAARLARGTKPLVLSTTQRTRAKAS